MYDDVALQRNSLLTRGPSWAAEFPVDTPSITLDADLVLAKFPTGIIPSGTALGLVTATNRYAPYGGTTDEVVLLTVGGSGLTSFTLTFGAQTTGSIAAAATAATVQAALEALSTIGAGNVVVTGGAGGPWTVTFAGTLADTNVGAITTTPTGGTGSVTPTVPTTGGADGSADGTQVGRGLLLATKTVRAGMHVDAALYYKGRVFEDKLPAGHLVDAAFKTDLPMIRFDKVGV